MIFIDIYFTWVTWWWNNLFIF